jgi:hypothetical protein
VLTLVSAIGYASTLIYGLTGQTTSSSEE